MGKKHTEKDKPQQQSQPTQDDSISACLINQYDEFVVALVPDGSGYYKLPDSDTLKFMAAGDTYRVIEYHNDIG